MNNSFINITSFFKDAQPKQVKKGEILLRPGDIVDYFIYTNKGCLRSYIIDAKGKEHIYQFAPEDWILTDEIAVANGTPAIIYIDAIENSEVMVVKVPKGNSFNDLDKQSLIEMNQKLTNKTLAMRTRIMQLLSTTAEERYNEFMKLYPSLVQRVPLKMIASYLGITPESLSRVRKEMVSKR